MHFRPIFELMLVMNKKWITPVRRTGVTIFFAEEIKTFQERILGAFLGF